MKKVWVNVVPWNKEVAITALESGADALLVPKGFGEKVKELGMIKTIAPDGDIKLGKQVIQFEISSKEDEKTALKLSKSKTLILKMSDWTIIPLENLIAQTQGLIAQVKDAKEAKTALGILEKGVDGVFLNTTDLNEVKKTVSLVKNASISLELQVARIKKKEPLAMGDRVCIDTCTNMGLGEGILVGNSSRALFLVHSESVENPYVEARPFRVNAGAVHAYTLVAESKTKYLSELKSGDEALVVNSQGETKLAVIGRTKIERRPLMLVEAETGEGERVSLILQNAETIRLTQPKGNPISVVELEEGSEVLVYLEKGGRHFGMKVEETITEK